MAGRAVRSTRETTVPGTRELLLEQAERVIARRGLEALTLKDIAAPLGIRVPSIYSHFASRDDILTAVAARYVAALAQQFPDDGRSDPLDVLLEGTRGLVLYFAAHPAHVRLKLRDLETPGGRPELSLAAAGDAAENLQSGPLQPLFSRLERLLERGRRVGRFRRVDVPGLYRTVFGVTLLSLTWPTQDIFTSAKDPQEISRILRYVEEVVRRYVSA